MSTKRLRPKPRRRLLTIAQRLKREAGGGRRVPMPKLGRARTRGQELRRKAISESYPDDDRS